MIAAGCVVCILLEKPRGDKVRERQGKRGRGRERASELFVLKRIHVMMQNI